MNRRPLLISLLAAAWAPGVRAAQKKSMSDPLLLGVEQSLVDSGLAAAFQRAFGRDTGIVVNFSMPLAFANRNQGAIREAAIRREQVAVDKDAASVRVQADLFEFHQMLQSARAQVTSLREQLIPQADAALTQTREAYERGRFSYLELAAAQQELIDLQASAIAAAATYHRVLAEIERLTNTPMLAKD